MRAKGSIREDDAVPIPDLARYNPPAELDATLSLCDRVYAC